MPEPKFFVWARGRWRELCLSSGRVQGAGGPVRFLYVRGARLQAARAPRVLRALRALAAGQPATARDGAPLPQRRRVRRPHRSHSCRRHHCCAAHTQCATSFSEAPKPRVESPPPPQPAPPPPPPPRADAAIQATHPAPSAREKTTQPNLLPQSPKAGTAKVPPRPRVKRKRSRTPRKRERSDTSADGLSVAAFKRREFCKELLINEHDADLFRSYLMDHDPDFDLYRFDSDDAYKMQFFYRINPLVTLVPCRQLEAMLLRRASQDTISLKDFATKLGLRSISDQEESENKRYKMRRRTKALAASSTTTSDGDTDKENLTQNRRAEAPASHRKKDSIGEKKNKEVTSNKRNDVPVVRESRRKDTSVEDKNESDEPPVDRTLRKRLMVAAVQRNIGNLDKSEENKEVTNNKRKNSPVVRETTKRDTPGANKEKDDPPVDRLRKRLMVAAVQCSDDRNIGNLDKSVENNSLGKNDKKNVENSRSNRSDSKSVDNNSRNKSVRKSVENNNLSKSHKKGVDKNSTSKDNAKSVNNKKVGATVLSASTSSSDSGREFSGTKPRFFTKKKPAVPKPSAVKLMSQTSKKSSMTSIGSKKCGGGREYLPLEDHAIVAFVSTGDRARRVNGNLLWRELQEQYHRLTGQSRSWHSLRNRYLRYILPALGQLALAPALVARLRANAAKGEIKSRKRPSLSAPNPLCVAPRVRSAFAARATSRSVPSPTPSRSPSPSPTPSKQPPPLPASEGRPLRARRRENTDTPSPTAPASAPPRRSLRSSGVVPPPPASPPARPPSQPPTASVRPRMRKLFNPNAHTMR